MVLQIIQLVIGVFLLFEAGKRMLCWNYAADFSYQICRPFKLSLSMRLGIIITFLEIVLGTIFLYNGIIGMI